MRLHLMLAAVKRTRPWPSTIQPRLIREGPKEVGMAWDQIKSKEKGTDSHATRTGVKESTLRWGQRQVEGRSRPGACNIHIPLKVQPEYDLGCTIGIKAPISTRSSWVLLLTAHSQIVDVFSGMSKATYHPPSPPCYRHMWTRWCRRHYCPFRRGRAQLREKD